MSTIARILAWGLAVFFGMWACKQKTFGFKEIVIITGVYLLFLIRTVSQQCPNNMKNWIDKHYRCIMLTSMVIELILLAWIAYRA